MLYVIILIEATSSFLSPKEYDLTIPGIEKRRATIGIRRVLLDFKDINTIKIITLAKNIIQKAKPKKAVHTKTEGLIRGHIEHRNADIKAAIPQTPIISLPNP
jgi:hypothetical protein